MPGTYERMNIQGTGNTDYIPHTIGIPRWCHTKLAYTTVYPGMGFDGFFHLTATFFFVSSSSIARKGGEREKMVSAGTSLYPWQREIIQP